jgi:hypothetical protein
MSDTVTGLLIGLVLVLPALLIPLTMEIVYRRRERRDGKR